MKDTRLQQAKELIEELAAEGGHSFADRTRLTDILTNLTDLATCRQYALGGPRCELDDDGHETHQRTYESGRVFTWTDESQKKLAERYL